MGLARSRKVHFKCNTWTQRDGCWGLPHEPCLSDSNLWKSEEKVRCEVTVPYTIVTVNQWTWPENSSGQVNETMFWTCIKTGHQREGQETLLFTINNRSPTQSRYQETGVTLIFFSFKNGKGHVCASHGKYDRHVWPVVKVMIAIVLRQMSLIHSVI